MTTYEIAWLILRLIISAWLAFYACRLILLSFDYLESVQNAVAGKLFAVRRRWWHKLTGRG